MNQFLHRLDTVDSLIRLRVSLSPVNDINIPELSIAANTNVIFNGKLSEQPYFETEIRLDEHLDLEIIMANNNAAIINSIEIDGFEIIPDYIHYSDYIGADGTEYGSTEYLGVSGKWHFRIDEPFYHWKHRVTGCGWLLTP